jgi:hypothetical protein
MASGERKLIVEITSARALMPKDGEGSSNAYCVVRSSFFVSVVAHVFFFFVCLFCVCLFVCDWHRVTFLLMNMELVLRNWISI